MKTFLNLLAVVFLTLSGHGSVIFKFEPIDVGELSFTEQETSRIEINESSGTLEFTDSRRDSPQVQIAKPTPTHLGRMPTAKVDRNIDHKLLIKEPDDTIVYRLLMRDTELSGE